MHKSVAIGCTIGCLLAACTPGPDSSTHLVRDSAGIRIVETAVAAGTLAPWSIAPEPVFRIGLEEDGLLFGDVTSGVILDDGRTAVADGGSRLIHILGPSGELAATLGGEGHGPREFAQLTKVVYVSGDTILAQDAGNGRLSLYADGSLVDNARFVSWMGSTMYGLLGRLEEGYGLWPLALMGHPTEPQLGWHEYPILRLDDGLTRVDTVATLGLHFHADPGDDNPMRPVGTVSVAGGELVYGTSDRPEIIWAFWDGNVRQIARWDAPAEEVEDEDWATYERGYRERYADLYPPAELERRLAIQREDFSGTPPYFGRVVGDREGHVWLTPYQFSGSTTGSSIYSVVARNGQYMGEVEFPRAVRLLDVAGDAVLGVEFGDYDVQAVVLYHLRGRPAEPLLRR